MSKQLYQRLMRARYSQLRRSKVSVSSPKRLEEILAMQHPHREAAFVMWAQLEERKLLLH